MSRSDFQIQKFHFGKIEFYFGKIEIPVALGALCVVETMNIKGGGKRWCECSLSCRCMTNSIHLNLLLLPLNLLVQRQESFILDVAWNAQDMFRMPHAPLFFSVMFRFDMVSSPLVFSIGCMASWKLRRTNATRPFRSRMVRV
jgi:hypothetical protein